MLRFTHLANAGPVTAWPRGMSHLEIRQNAEGLRVPAARG